MNASMAVHVILGWLLRLIQFKTPDIKWTILEYTHSRPELPPPFHMCIIFCKGFIISCTREDYFKWAHVFEF